MVNAYLPILIMVILAAVFGVFMMLFSWIVGRIGRSGTDLRPYECGLDPMDEPEKRISIRYYVVALLFLLFDVETLFLYPVAAVFRERAAMPAWRFFVYGEMVLFVAILIVGYVYVWRKGALKWE
ncbi:MAG: NADH-quinone oxidoreductase subunit A [Acidobacteriota bacterium]|jgi:NADH-quinone oxidoreductase subunit A